MPPPQPPQHTRTHGTQHQRRCQRLAKYIETELWIGVRGALQDLELRDDDADEGEDEGGAVVREVGPFQSWRKCVSTSRQREDTVFDPDLRAVNTLREWGGRLPVPPGAGTATETLARGNFKLTKVISSRGTGNDYGDVAIPGPRDPGRAWLLAVGCIVVVDIAACGGGKLLIPGATADGLDLELN